LQRRARVNLTVAREVERDAPRAREAGKRCSCAANPPAACACCAASNARRPPPQLRAQGRFCRAGDGGAERAAAAAVSSLKLCAFTIR